MRDREHAYMTHHRTLSIQIPDASCLIAHSWFIHAYSHRRLVYRPSSSLAHDGFSNFTRYHTQDPAQMPNNRPFHALSPDPYSSINDWWYDGADCWLALLELEVDDEGVHWCGARGSFPVKWRVIVMRHCEIPNMTQLSAAACAACQHAGDRSIEKNEWEEEEQLGDCHCVSVSGRHRVACSTAWETTWVPRQPECHGHGGATPSLVPIDRSARTDLCLQPCGSGSMQQIFHASAISCPLFLFSFAGRASLLYSLSPALLPRACSMRLEGCHAMPRLYTALLVCSYI
jgi:hypothetical protein